MDESGLITTGTSAAEQRLKVGVGSSGGKSVKKNKLKNMIGALKKDGKGGPGAVNPLAGSAAGAFAPMNQMSAANPMMGNKLNVGNPAANAMMSAAMSPRPAPAMPQMGGQQASQPTMPPSTPMMGGPSQSPLPGLMASISKGAPAPSPLGALMKPMGASQGIKGSTLSRGAHGLKTPKMAKMKGLAGPAKMGLKGIAAQKKSLLKGMMVH